MGYICIIQIKIQYLMLFYPLLLCETVFVGLKPSSWIVEAAHQGVASGRTAAVCNASQMGLTATRRTTTRTTTKGFMRGAVALTDLKTDGLQPDVREEFMISVPKWSRSAAMVREGERRAQS